MFKLTNDFLLIGIGNPGRCDDGLGWAMLDRLEDRGYDGTCEYRLQLNIEDAELISHYEKVLIVDASQAELPGGFRFQQVVPDTVFTYTTHSVAPATIAHLCQDLFGRAPNIYLLEIRGYDWEIGEGLSADAANNLDRALKVLIPSLMNSIGK